VPKKKQAEVKIWDAVPGYDFIEEVDLAAIPSWFLDGTHSVPPLTPLFTYQWARFCSHGFKAACYKLGIPTCKGWEIRIFNGGIYCGLHIVRDQEEIARREVKFPRRCGPGSRTSTATGTLLRKSCWASTTSLNSSMSTAPPTWNYTTTTTI
jgi:hypothetical protein